MIKRDELTKYIYSLIGSELMKKAKTVDTMPNGVQVKGKENVRKVALGVSNSAEFFKEAVKAKADYCIFHHGMNLNDNIVCGRLDAFEARLKLVFKHELTVAGFHYCLDVHPEIGNNATIIKKLKAKRLEELFFDGWGWVAEFDKSQDPKELANLCSKIFEHDVFSVFGGPVKVKRIGVCSGGAMPRNVTLMEVIDKKIDCLITGVITESGPDVAKELGYHYLAGGHYATEVFGVQELGKKIKEHYQDNLEVEFIDIPNLL